MYTSLVLVALAGWSAEADQSVVWQTSYAKARTEARGSNKPLAVIVGRGAEGWKDLARDKDLSARAAELLRAHYLCVYADISKPEGRQLADSLEIRDVGLVVSSKDGSLQAFRHAGTLSASTLERTLQTYSDPTRVVTTTDTLVSTTVRTGYTPTTTSAGSYLPANAYTPSFAPAMSPYYGGFGGYGGYGGGYGGYGGGFGGYGGGCPGGMCR